MTKPEIRSVGHWTIRHSFIILISLLVISPSIAQTFDLTINADNVSYEKENNLVIAEGSVEVRYMDIVVYGNNIVYNSSRETVHAVNGFNLVQSGISIEGDTLDYEIKEQTGVATDVSFNYKEIELAGRQIEFTADEYKLRNATFSTCDLKDTHHYRVTAGEIILYPEYGWLVAYWGFFWLDRFPIVPMPTYIYDIYAAQKNRKNIPPFPEVGSNDEDGTYVNERLAWHLSRELSGIYSINYASKKGIGGGVEADYILNEDSRGNARIYSRAGDGMWGGITHFLFFGNEIGETSKIPFVFLEIPKQRQYELKTTLSYRERINYQRVSFYPELRLIKNKESIGRKELKFEGEIGAAKIKEEDNIALSKGDVNASLSWDFPEGPFGFVTPYLSLDFRRYSNAARWDKTMGGINFSKTFYRQTLLDLGYLHYFSVEGASPFLYGMYRFNRSDRFTSRLFFLLGETGIQVSTSYFIENWTPEDIDYTLFFKMHCYNLEMHYRSLRREFSLGFSLAGTNNF